MDRMLCTGVDPCGTGGSALTIFGLGSGDTITNVLPIAVTYRDFSSVQHFNGLTNDLQYFNSVNCTKFGQPILRKID